MALLISTPIWADGVVNQKIDKGWTFKQERGNNWYPATVPGVVHTDLMDNKIIEDPFFRLNERGVQWIDKEDWIYKIQLNVSSELFDKDNIELDFKGLDTYADVYLNDSCILKANNMFREWRVDVKGLLKKADNELRIYFHSPIKMDIPKFDALNYVNEAGNDQSQNGGVFDKKVSVFARKAGYHYGWDWGPRLVTSGIWRPVYLEGWNNARIDNVHYIQEKVSAKRANIKVKAEVLADKAGEAVLTIKADGIKNGWTTKASLTKGVNLIEKDIVVNNPKLWWSNGLGEPHLYSFTTTVSFNGKEADSRTENLGIRELKVINEKDEFGHTFYFRLNGVNVFAKGANYIPQDNFLPRLTFKNYEKTILDAVNANMNMLRIWGGGIYEEDMFYELCDKYGILVWQDFMFACSTYPMNPEMLDNIRHEAKDNIIRLRNHPSIAIWCGNNESHTAWFNWGWMPKFKKLGVLDEMRKDYKDVFHGVLEEAVAEYDPTAFYWPSSPYGGDPDAKCESGTVNWNPNGDAHYWGVWHAKDSIANYNHIRARFFSEYGFQSFPEYQSVLKYAPEERDHDIFSEVMMAHQRGGSHANGLIEWYLLNEYRKPKDFQNFLYMGQLLQGDAIKTAIEAHRRDMPYCMGSLYWQHNDCWPVASWSSRDYYGRWKAQHYFAKKAFANILVSPIAENGTLNVYVVSDNLYKIKGHLILRVLDLKGNVVTTQKVYVTLPANTSKIQLTEKIEKLLGDKKANEVVVNVRFTPNKGETVSSNYFLTRYKDIDFPKANIKLQSTPASDGFDVTVESDTFARGVFLSIEGIDNFFSDNYFDLLPGEPVKIHVKTSLDKITFDKQLKSVSISDAY
ncbi:glycoside hydrolase family 2 protein [Massilibacteroides sp.]|uniref:beta-mannosidase n=1 Tax=Massilibacteroides sp. TaxID=2034766 RepID=UPI0026376525|nr:glycoside hydrolase family 2 protein [Massilibacteroides sp.]MDD4514592.1 glycoside hydrolase family 2 TIM barrel-domain containing protein [Massilibacteroides sp.]